MKFICVNFILESYNVNILRVVISLLRNMIQVSTLASGVFFRRHSDVLEKFESTNYD